MIDMPTGIADRAAALRQNFDRAFALPQSFDAESRNDVLAVRIGPEACAFRLEDIAGVHAGRKITPLPGQVGAFLGFAGFRGSVVPVYSLSKLFGHAATESPRWLVTATNAPLALAFDAFEGHLRVSSEEVVPRNAQQGLNEFVSGYMRTPDSIRAIVDMTAVLHAIDELTNAGHRKGIRDHV